MLTCLVMCLQLSFCFLLQLKKSNRVTKPDTTPDFRREVFDEGQVIAIFFVENVESVCAEDVRVMISADDVGSSRIEQIITGGFGFKRKSFGLTTCQNCFRAHAQIFIFEINAESSA